MSSTAPPPGEPGDPAAAGVAASAVAVMRSTVPMRAAADAVELQAVATLAWVRREEAVALARSVAREADVARGLTPGTTRPGRVDIDRVDRLCAQEVSLALTLSPVVARERLELAMELVGRRPVTFEALRAGEIDLVRARRICDAVRTLPVISPDRGGPDGDADGPDGADGSDGADGADGREGLLAAAVEAEVLYPGSVPALADRRPARSAGELTPAQLTARLARLVMRADPAGAADRTTLADARRGCSLRALPDGMALLSVTGRAELLGAVYTRLDSVARQLLIADSRGSHPDADHPDSTGRAAVASSSTMPWGATAPADSVPDGPAGDSARTLDQTRVDVLIGTLLGDSHDLTRAHNVTIDLALVATAGTVLAGGDEPGDLDGYGPVPAPLVRALAADARWRRWDTDPTTGHVTATTARPGSGPRSGDGTGPGTGDEVVAPVGVGVAAGAGLGAGAPAGTGATRAGAAGCGSASNRHRVYRPTVAVADLVRARDRTCRFPTCRRRAVACDLDHVVPFPEGDTCHTTLATECRLHHICKHQGGFSLTITPDGTTTWTTPTGQVVTTHPPSWGRPPPRGDDRARPGASGQPDAPPF